MASKSDNAIKKTCKYIDWSTVSIVFMVIMIGGLYGVWVLESVNLGFIAIVIAIICVIGGVGFLLKYCIRIRR